MHILMDLDDVLIKNTYINQVGGVQFYWTEKIEEDLGIKESLLINLFNKSWDDVILGKLELKVHIKNFLATIESSVSEEEFIDYWLKNDSILNIKMINWALKMHEKGYKLSIATNQESTRMQNILNKYKDFFSVFENIFTSAELGFKKPEAEFFLEILSRLGLSVEEVLFIDDSAKNIIGAGKVGMKTMKYSIADGGVEKELEKELEKLLEGQFNNCF